MKGHGCLVSFFVSGLKYRVGGMGVDSCVGNFLVYWFSWMGKNRKYGLSFEFGFVVEAGEALWYTSIIFIKLC